jgi:hypothetical protein
MNFVLKAVGIGKKPGERGRRGNFHILSFFSLANPFKIPIASTQTLPLMSNSFWNFQPLPGGRAGR